MQGDRVLLLFFYVTKQISSSEVLITMLVVATSGARGSYRPSGWDHGVLSALPAAGWCLIAGGLMTTSLSEMCHRSENVEFCGLHGAWLLRQVRIAVFESFPNAFDCSGIAWNGTAGIRPRRVLVLVLSACRHRRHQSPTSQTRTCSATSSWAMMMEVR